MGLSRPWPPHWPPLVPMVPRLPVQFWSILTTSSLASRRLDEVDEGPQRRGHEAPSGVIKKWPRKAQPPWLKHWLQRAAIKMRTQPVLEEIDDAGTGDRCVDGEIGRPAGPHDQRPRRIDAHYLAV